MKVQIVNHTPLTRSARCVVVTNNRPTTTMDAFDYHLTGGEAMDTMRQPNVRTNRCSSA